MRMNSTATTSTVLIVYADRAMADEAAAALGPAGYVSVGCVPLGAAAIAAATDLRPDLVLVIAVAPERETFSQLAMLSAALPRPILMFTEDDAEAHMKAALRAGVSAYIVRGFATARLRTLLQMASARFAEYEVMHAELESAKTSLRDRKLIEQAKGILISQRGYDEAGAYRALRKLAMDRNRRLGDVAADVVAMSKMLVR